MRGPLSPSERKNTDGSSRRVGDDALRNGLAAAAKTHLPGWADTLTPHVLRPFCASELYLGGLGLLGIQAVLGHSWIATTMRYIHVQQTRVEDAWVTGQQRAAKRLEGPAGSTGNSTPTWPTPGWSGPGRPLGCWERPAAPRARLRHRREDCHPLRGLCAGTAGTGSRALDSALGKRTWPGARSLEEWAAQRARQRRGRELGANSRSQHREAQRPTLGFPPRTLQFA
ncbi:tyrosine-type recombinase/integrase [Streptomyces sp. NPDC001880]